MSTANTIPLPNPKSNSRGVICSGINSSTSVQTWMSQSKYFIPPVTLCLITTTCLSGVGWIGAELLCPMLIQHINVLRDVDPIHRMQKHPELFCGRRGKGWGAAVWETKDRRHLQQADRQTSVMHPGEQQSSNWRDGMIYLLVGVWGSGMLRWESSK